MSNFHPLPDRDAWPTIRGYVYQVDHTILRWLDLQPDEVLELERGEDIDLVLPGLAESDDELQRRLEQVKHREGNLTLRSSEALTAIANYHAYRIADSGARLYFCFTTNAQPGQEKLSPMPDRQPALIVWNALRDGSVSAAQQPGMMTGIRRIVASANAPDGITPERWRAAAAFFASAPEAELLDFIGGFEWSMGAGEAPELGRRIQERLLTDGSVSDEAAARAVYERMFLHVFKTLTQRGVKRLTRDALIVQLAQPTLSSADAHLLASLKQRVSEVERRVAAVEGTVAEHRVVLERVSADLQRLVRPDGPLGVIRYIVETPILDIPPLAERRSEREETVDQLADTTAEHPWLALHGGVGAGKTQLGALLVRRLAVRTIWLALRGLDPEESGERVDAACAAATGIAAASSRADWYQQVCVALGSGSLIVLDDLPRFAPTDGLGRRLDLLAGACEQAQVYLLTTSVHLMPPGMYATTHETILRETTVPPFTDAEAADLLRAYGAPVRLLQAKPINFLNGVAGQHPALLTAMARFLAARDWRVSGETFEDLIRRTFASEVNDETMHHLLETVEDGDSRELLYRLTLIRHPFALDDAKALAAVPAVVRRPRERLDALGGLWIQRDAGERFSVSPLVTTFGASELEQATTHGCHLVLGERIVARRVMAPPQILEAIIHFQDAAEFDRAGALLAWALSELNGRADEVPDFGLLSAWGGLPLPSGMKLGIRIHVRALQVAGRVARGMSADDMLSDLDALVAQSAEGEAWALLGVVVATTGLLDAERAVRYLRSAFRLIPAGRGPDGHPLALPEDLRYEDLIWSAVPAIVTHDHLREWLSLIEAMTPEQRARAFSDEQFAENSAFALAEQVWLREVDKPAEQRDWSAVLHLLEELARRTRAINAEILWACAVRAEVVVRAEFGEELAIAVDVAETALVLAPSEARIQFLLRECVGRQYLYAGQADAAIEWLSAAITYETTAFPRVRMAALLSLSRALLAAGDGDAAVQGAQRAVDIARENDRISETDVVRALGELAIAQWKAQGVAAAFAAWDEAGERLFACRSESELWRDLYVMYGHVSGYFTTLASTSQPQEVTAAGEPYEPPKAGMLLEVRTSRAPLYRADRDAYLAAQLAMFAEAVERDDRAATWAARGIKWARESRQWLALSQLGLSGLPPLVFDDRYGDVLETGLETGALTVALGTLRGLGERTVMQTGDYNELLGSAFGPRPGPRWQQAEELALLLGAVPVAFRLATIALEDAARAKASAREVAALCREIAASAADARLWTIAADCLEQTFVTGASSRDLLDIAAQLDTDPASASGLRIITRLGASLLVRGSPQLAFRIHQGLIPYMRQILQNQPGMYRQVVTPFVVAFWKARLAERRIHFRLPSAVELRLTEALADRDGDMAQRVIDAIAPGLV